MPIQLIVGLQNPGARYEHTRHNAGAWFVNQLADQIQASWRENKNLKGSLLQAGIQDHLCWLCLPNTFMNHSGQTVRAVTQYYRILPEQVLVVHDELDLSPGVVRLKQGGGHGGHNGLKDIIAHLGTNSFCRMRIGIGHPGTAAEVHDYVLSKPSSSDFNSIHDAIARAITILPKIIAGDIASAMNALHRKE